MSSESEYEPALTPLTYEQLTKYFLTLTTKDNLGRNMNVNIEIYGAAGNYNVATKNGVGSILLTMGTWHIKPPKLDLNKYYQPSGSTIFLNSNLTVDYVFQLRDIPLDPYAYGITPEEPIYGETLEPTEAPPLPSAVDEVYCIVQAYINDRIVTSKDGVIARLYTKGVIMQTRTVPCAFLGRIDYSNIQCSYGGVTKTQWIVAGTLTFYFVSAEEPPVEVPPGVTPPVEIPPGEVIPLPPEEEVSDGLIADLQTDELKFVKNVFWGLVTVSMMGGFAAIGIKIMKGDEK